MRIKELLVGLSVLAILPMTGCYGDKTSSTSSNDGQTKVNVDRDLTETNVDYTKKDGTTVKKEYDKNGNLTSEKVDN